MQILNVLCFRVFYKTVALPTAMGDDAFSSGESEVSSSETGSPKTSRTHASSETGSLKTSRTHATRKPRFDVASFLSGIVGDMADSETYGIKPATFDGVQVKVQKFEFKTIRDHRVTKVPYHAVVNLSTKDLEPHPSATDAMKEALDILSQPIPGYDDMSVLFYFGALRLSHSILETVDRLMLEAYAGFEVASDFSDYDTSGKVDALNCFFGKLLSHFEKVNPSKCEGLELLIETFKSAVLSEDGSKLKPIDDTSFFYDLYALRKGFLELFLPEFKLMKAGIEGLAKQKLLEGKYEGFASSVFSDIPFDSLVDLDLQILFLIIFDKEIDEDGMPEDEALKLIEFVRYFKKADFSQFGELKALWKKYEPVVSKLNEWRWVNGARRNNSEGYIKFVKALNVLFKMDFLAEADSNNPWSVIELCSKSSEISTAVGDFLRFYKVVGQDSGFLATFVLGESTAEAGALKDYFDDPENHKDTRDVVGIRRNKSELIQLNSEVLDRFLTFAETMKTLSSGDFKETILPLAFLAGLVHAEDVRVSLSGGSKVAFDNVLQRDSSYLEAVSKEYETRGVEENPELHSSQRLESGATGTMLSRFYSIGLTRFANDHIASLRRTRSSVGLEDEKDKVVGVFQDLLKDADLKRAEDLANEITDKDNDAASEMKEQEEPADNLPKVLLRRRREQDLVLKSSGGPVSVHKLVELERNKTAAKYLTAVAFLKRKYSNEDGLERKILDEVFFGVWDRFIASNLKVCQESPRYQSPPSKPKDVGGLLVKFFPDKNLS